MEVRYFNPTNSMNNLLKTYKTLESTLGLNSIESFKIINTVHDYRLFWKPKKVKTVLLAESHLFTSDSEHESYLDSSYLKLPGYPNKYVRFVYCLGYGENAILNLDIPDNRGTPDYWKIFYSCCNKINSNEDCKPILKTKTEFDIRIKNKIELLNSLKDRGIWLLDASIIALYIPKKQKPVYEIIDKCINICWDLLIEDILVKEKPRNLICIGKTVEKVLHGKLNKMFRHNLTVLPQPNAHLKSEKHLEVLQSYFGLCNQ